MGTESYRQAIPDLNLSIEKATDKVPDDGKYYVLQNGKVLGAFRNLKQAQVLYRKIVQESGYKPTPVTTTKSAAEMATENYLAAKDLYWAESHKYRGGGGRGGRGGV
jgi:hypothetical protein